MKSKHATKIDNYHLAKSIAGGKKVIEQKKAEIAEQKRKEREEERSKLPKPKSIKDRMQEMLEEQEARLKTLE